MNITIHEDTTFLIADERGDVHAGTELGLYSEDTRFLSRYLLRLDGSSPVALSARSTRYFAAEHFLTNPDLQGVPASTLGVTRRRSIGRGMREELELINYGDSVARFTLELLFDADFAHIFDVKRNPRTAGAAGRQAGRMGPTVEDHGRVQRFRFARAAFRRELLIHLSTRPRSTPGRCCFPLELPPRSPWDLTLTFDAASLPGHGRADVPRQGTRTPGRVKRRDRPPAEATTPMPVLRTDSYVLLHAHDRSARDYAALRIRGETISRGDAILAAGIPWYLALFGRDSLIAAYQAVIFDPDVARGVLDTLGRLQGTEDDPARGEEPGKILHEHRFGILAGTQRNIPKYPYYGTIDATPLYLILLAAVVRCTGDLSLARQLRGTAIRALEWMERWGDRDGDGYLEYVRRSDVGLDNQGWKDSRDSVRFRDGRLADAPIALCEVQGYAYAARLGMADVFDALGESARAAGLRDAAQALEQRFNRDFWIESRGFYAEALDRDKRPVDSLTSNPGHLLWTGIADPEKARRVAERLVGPELFSGWGVRTMGAREGGYNPISYHNGSVWPHDNSLIAYGLARYGFLEEASRIVAGLLDAVGHLPEFRFPELFAGYGRDEASFPVPYPTACRPQAWASGSIFLILTAMLGIDLEAGTDVLAGRPFLPRGITRIRLDHLWVGGRQVAIEVSRDASGAVVRRVHGAAAKRGAGS